MSVPLSLWPLFGLCLRTARLELRLPGTDDLGALAALAAEGIHDPETMPFSVPWTDVSPQERARSVLRWQWNRWAAWRPECWGLDLVVLAHGVVVGQQSLDAANFAALREANTGSWLGRRFHGQGIGTEMRAAVLHLAFDGLGAGAVYSGAFEDNPASMRVSRKLGYLDNGIERVVRRGQPATLQRLRLPRESWDANRRVPVDITGLDACIDWFGLDRD
jgi:RimJ/RimL family protein N-acetyltransferase